MSKLPRPDESPAAKVIPLNRAPSSPAVASPEAVSRPEVTRRVMPRPPIEPAPSDGQGFPRQTYPLRMLGVVLGAPCVGGTLAAIGAPAWCWVLLAMHLLCWPHLAWWRARRSADPRRAEYGNLLVDSALGGAWVALMQVALLPSMVLVAMLSMDKAAVGGWRLLLRHLPVQAAAFLAVWIPMGMPFQPESEMPAMLAALPMLLGYPVSIAFAVHTLGRRVRRQNRTLRALNRSDALTGLGNRRAIEEALAAEFHRCERSGRPAALLLVDLDGFKTINDRFGHGFGDDVLRRVGLAIRGCVREIDTAARLGGDEFAVLLPETEVDTAIYVATRIRSAIGAQIFERAPGLHCTASIGVAGVAPVAAGPEGWMERADRALYRAKDEGRDCVRAAT
jgi:diguanylate cyclase